MGIKIICKEKHMINQFKTSSQSYETVESFPYVFLVTVPSTLFTKSKLHRLYWPPFASIRDCYGEIFSSTFLKGIYSSFYTLDKTKNIFLWFSTVYKIYHLTHSIFYMYNVKKIGLDNPNIKIYIFFDYKFLSSW